ncbi:hypothetical protein [Streptomyces sulfonofaciens]|uniref:hypothetical protein n=1 Tax=Streptomyces sulfonofaciens TaxID=68272 RepID=UPI00167555D0|nr:hypothetical protein [Streptomyces sulfonofaciens]
MHIQVFVNAILKMPIATSDFTKRYGTFNNEDQDEIKKFLAAVKSMQGLSLRFGDPVTITQRIAKDGDYITGANAPAELYAHNMWMANQVNGVAAKFHNRCGLITGHLEDGKGAIKQNAAIVRQFLTGKDGLKDLVDKLHGQLKDLIQKLAAFSGDFQTQNEKLKLFVAKEGRIYSHAANARDECKAEAEEFQREADLTYSKWKKVSIAESALAPLGLLGGLVALGLGVWAAQLQKKYKALVDKVNKAKDEQQKKIQLLTDLDGLQTQVTPLTKYTDDFKAKLDVIEGKWLNASNAISQLAGLDDQKLGDKDNINHELDLEGAAQEWKKVADATSWFTQNALVSPRDIVFGADLPLQGG